MRQQFFDSTGGLGRQALEDVLEIAVRIVSVEFHGLDQAHDGGGPLAGAERSCKEPITSAERHRADAIFDMIVVDWQIAILEVASERCPTTQAVVDCFACGRPVRQLPTLTSEPPWRSFGCSAGPKCPYHDLF
jgi:hypothetical protein